MYKSNWDEEWWYRNDDVWLWDTSVFDWKVYEKDLYEDWHDESEEDD